MKISNINILVTKVEPKKNKEGGDYLSISFLDMVSGDTFNIITRDIEFMRLKQMTKYKNTILNLSSSKYGLKLDIEKIGEEQGGI